MKGFLFDLDGTLIESTEDLAGAGNYIRRMRGMEALSLQTIASYVGDGVEAMVSRLLQTEDKAVIEEFIPHFKTYYREHCVDTTRLYDEVLPVLENLLARGYKMAVVTNKPALISKRILAGLGVAHFFQVVVGGDSAPFKKPHPAPMHMACRELDIHPDHCVMVGDSVVDVAAGRSVRMATIGIRGGIGDQAALENSKPDLCLNSFKQILDHMGA